MGCKQSTEEIEVADDVSGGEGVSAALGDMRYNKSERDMLRNMLRNIPILLIDKEGIVLKTNKQACELLGTEKRGSRLETILEIKVEPRQVGNLEEYEEGKLLRLERSNGQSKLVYITISVLEENYVVAMVDISFVKELNIARLCADMGISVLSSCTLSANSGCRSNSLSSGEGAD